MQEQLRAPAFAPGHRLGGRLDGSDGDADGRIAGTHVTPRVDGVRMRLTARGTAVQPPSPTEKLHGGDVERLAIAVDGHCPAPAP